MNIHHQKLFSALTDEAESEQAFSRSSFEEIDHDRLYSVEKRCRRLQKNLIFKNEELKTIVHMLDQLGNETVDTENMVGFIKDSSEKLTTSNSENLNITLLENAIPYNIEKGKRLLEQGCVGEAFARFKNVLKVDPENNDVFSIFSKLRNEKKHHEKNKQLQSRYRLEYSGSFGHELLKNPTAIIAAGSDRLIVSDYATDRVHEFTLSGEYVRPLPIDVIKPMGLFLEDGHLWICDFGNRRLLAVDARGRAIDEIHMEQVVGEHDDNIHPVYGCVEGERFFIILTDRNMGIERNLIAFNKRIRDISLKVVPPGGTTFYTGFGQCENEVYFASRNPLAFFTYKTQEDRVELLKIDFIPEALNVFSKTADACFLCTMGYLIKMTLSGEVLFYAKFTKLLDGREINPTCIASASANRRNVLLVGDYSHPCIHKFSI